MCFEYGYVDRESAEDLLKNKWLGDVEIKQCKYVVELK